MTTFFLKYFQYSSRDEVTSSSSDTKQIPSFGSISSPSSYRPSYSGGTYRSAGIKRDPQIASSYPSRWLVGMKDSVPKEKDTSPVKKSTKLTPTKETSNESKSTTNRLVASSGSLGTKTKLKEQVSTPPPSSTRPSMTVSKLRNCDPSPLNSTYSVAKSRDPSPSDLLKDRYPSTSAYLTSSYNKLYSKTGSKLQVCSLNTRPMNASAAISYLNASDASVRRSRRVKDDDKTTKSSVESSAVKDSKSEEACVGSSKESSLNPKERPEMIEVTVVNRATSPNLCSTTTTISNFSRCRRAEIAKTIEKVILRPKQKAACVDKEMQSDRMDDTSKYCRFNATNMNSPWPTYIESKSANYSRANNGTSLSQSKYSSSSKSEKSSNESSPEKSTERNSTKSRENSVSKSSSSSRSSSVKSTKSEKSKSKSPPVASQKSSSVSPPKQRAFNNKTLPPPAPKVESPPKTLISVPTSAIVNNGKWANKDFRKSALNVGPTDRPRKSRTSSIDTDSEEVKRSGDGENGPAKSLIAVNRTERSPSISSETSYSSNTTASNIDDVSKNFVKLKISQTSSSTSSSHPLPETADENMHLESNSVTFTVKIPPNSDAQAQQKRIPLQLQNESCTKIDNVNSSTAFRALCPNTKIFKTQLQQSYDAQISSDNNDSLSTHDSIKQDTLNESMFNQTTTISNETKIANSQGYLADDSSWIDPNVNDKKTTVNNNFAEKSRELNMKSHLQHSDSAQVPWWMIDGDNDDTVADEITLNQSENDYVSGKIEEGNNNHLKAINLNQVSTDAPDTRKAWWRICESTSLNEESDENKKFGSRFRRIESGERAWWLDDNKEPDTGDVPERENTCGSVHTLKIKKIESGERAWWMCENDTETTNVEATRDINSSNNEEVDFWADINESLEASRRSLETSSQTNKINNNNTTNQCSNNYACDINANHIPLGDRASPDGLEDFNMIGKEHLLTHNTTNGMEKSFKKLFISRHQNIDDLLGGSCHTLSPMLIDQISAVDCDTFQEILPSEVRIHDGKPQISRIQYMEAERYDLYLPIHFICN